MDVEMFKSVLSKQLLPLTKRISALEESQKHQPVVASTEAEKPAKDEVDNDGEESVKASEIISAARIQRGMSKLFRDVPEAVREKI